MMAKKTMNVLQLISSLEVGGSEKLLLSLLSACRDNDDVSYAVVVMNRNVNPQMREDLNRMSMPVYYLDRPEGHLHAKYLKELLQIIDRHHIQVVHSHNRGSKMWGVLCKLLRPSLKLVFTIHDTMMLPRLDAVQVAIHKYLIDCNIAISKSVAMLCEKRGIHNYRQIYNGIPLQRFRNPEKPGLQARLVHEPLEQKPLEILNVGRMDAPTKGQDILIEAVKHCRDQNLPVRCKLLGGVYDYNRESFEKLKRMVRELKLENHVEFMTRNPDVPRALSRADVFVLPSRKEGLGLVILEAMAAGVPVIASNIDGPRELVEDGVNGYTFESDNAWALAEKIKQVIRAPEKTDRMRIQALQSVEQFDIHQMKWHYFRLYHDILQADERRKGLILRPNLGRAGL